MDRSRVRAHESLNPRDVLDASGLLREVLRGYQGAEFFGKDFLDFEAINTTVLAHSEPTLVWSTRVIGIQFRSVRPLVTILILLLATVIYQKIDPPKQPPKAGNSSEKDQRKINPLPPLTSSIDSTTTKPNSGTNQTKIDDNWAHWITPIDPFFTAIIALFTALMYFNVRSQLHATKIGERAWLVPNIGSIEETKIKGTFQVICQITNNGRTPAWVTAAGSVGLIRKDEKELPKTPPYSPMGPFSETGSVLPPTAWLPQGFPLTNDQLTKVAKGEQLLYVTGFIEYRDIYKVKHRTSYCYQLKRAQDLTYPNPLDFCIAGPTEYNDAN